MASAFDDASGFDDTPGFGTNSPSSTVPPSNPIPQQGSVHPERLKIWRADLESIRRKKQVVNSKHRSPAVIILHMSRFRFRRKIVDTHTRQANGSSHSKLSQSHGPQGPQGGLKQ